MTGCIEWDGSINCNGYGKLSIGRIWHLAHRVVYAATKGLRVEALRGIDIMHVCDNRKCVNPRHLRAGTRAENVADMVRKQRHSKGADRWNAKLTAHDAQVIRERYKAGGVTQRELAEKFGVDQSQISYITSRRKWRHI